MLIIWLEINTKLNQVRNIDYIEILGTSAVCEVPFEVNSVLWVDDRISLIFSNNASVSPVLIDG